MVKYQLFTSKDCYPCKKMKKEILKNNNPLNIEIIDIEEKIDLAIDKNIMSVPTLLKIDGSDETKFVGYKTQAEIEKL